MCGTTSSGSSRVVLIRFPKVKGQGSEHCTVGLHGEFLSGHCNTATWRPSCNHLFLQLRTATVCQIFEQAIANADVAKRCMMISRTTAVLMSLKIDNTAYYFV